MASRLFHRSKQQGAALLLVLWVVALLTVMAAALLQIVQRANDSALLSVERLQSQALADSALNRTLWALTAREPTQHPHLDDRFRAVEVVGGHAEVAVSDEAGRVDFNAAPTELLRATISLAGAASAQSEIVTSDIETLRRKNPVPFLGVGDLRSVNGMTADLYDKLKPAITVFTRNSQPDLRYAPHVTTQTTSSQRMMPFEEGPSEAPSSEESQSLAARVVRIRIHSSLTGRNASDETVVLRLTGNDQNPFWILDRF